MLFRALNEVTHPVRGLDIGVVEKLTQRSEEAVPGRCPHRSAHEHKYDGGREHRIDRNFQGMLIERGQGFNSAGTVVNLVKDSPEKIYRMPCPMPPIEEEGAYEPAYEALRNIRKYAVNMKQGRPLEPYAPSDASKQYHSQLRSVQKHSPKIPAARFRQATTRKHSFHDYE